MPSWARDMDHVRGRPSLGVLERRMLRTTLGVVQGSVKDKPRYALRRSRYPEGDQYWKDMVNRTCCKNSGHQSCCPRLIRLVLEGIERREHDERNRLRVILRTLGVTEIVERQPQTKYWSSQTSNSPLQAYMVHGWSLLLIICILSM